MRRIATRQGLATLLMLGLLAAACESRQGAESRFLTATEVPERGAREPSLYGLDVRLRDQHGRALSLAELRGRVLVAAMMYSSCKTVCPRVTEDMKRIESRVAKDDGDDVAFVLFSIDPGRDTPAALRAFAQSHGLSSSRWRLLAASEDGVRDLAAALGVKYTSEGNGEIAHSAMILVIDRDGVVRHRQIGVRQELQELLRALAAAVGHP